MEMQFSVLLLCVLRITEGFPVSSQLSLAPSQSYTLLVPVSVLGLNGPQVVLVPVNTDWTAQRNQNPAARSEQTHTLTEAEQQHMNNRDLVENQNVNRPFLQLPTVSPDTPTPENPLPQGQVLPVWNSIPGVVPLQPGANGQVLFPVWTPPAGGAAGGAAGGQRQVVSVAQTAALSNSESSEEGDAQVIYILPVSAEISNMGIMEGVQGAVDPKLTPDPNPNANLHFKPNPNPNPESNPGHLQFHNTPAPSTAPSPVLPAGVQDITDPLGKVPPSVSAGQSTQTGGTTTSCKHKAEAAHAKANKPVL
ncbi:mucin-1 [Silurus meridionalis]|uniref:mucin-1 n=1 Tax=Silurus meridionalis TaxID=175797 RepID=UPI001EE9E7E7|nr:mucin-1 [Silurus meridionalis]